MHPQRRTASILAGLALILMPLLGFLLKTFSAGWLLIAVMWGPIFLMVPGYALVCVIAGTSYFSRFAALQAPGKRVRLTLSAWTTSIGIVMLGFFLVDGGDAGDYGSTFQYAIGLPRRGDGGADIHAATDDLSSTLAMLGAMLWLGGYVWLLIEWITDLVERRRLRSPGEYAMPGVTSVAGVPVLPGAPAPSVTQAPPPVTQMPPPAAPEPPTRP